MKIAYWGWVGVLGLAIAAGDASAAGKERSAKAKEAKVKMETFPLTINLLDARSKSIGDQIKSVRFCYYAYHDGQSTQDEPSTWGCADKKVTKAGSFRHEFQVPWERKSLMRMKFALEIPDHGVFKGTALGSDVMFKLPADVVAAASGKKVADRADSRKAEAPTNGMDAGRVSAASAGER